MLTNPALPLPRTTALPHLCVIRAAGDDAASFLHNQLTQDVSSLGPDEARLAGYCSVKGRLLASCVVLRPQADEVLLITPRSGAEALVKRLSMFVLRAKAKLSLAADWWVCGQLGEPTGLGVAAAAPWPVARTGDGHWQVTWPAVEGVARSLVLMPLAPAEHAAALAAWRWLEVRSGLAWVDAAVADAFVPQMLNFEAVGGVNFKKGCYPGQEVVARSQYRGTLKRRAHGVHSDAPLLPGQDLFCSADPAQPGGQVAMAAPCPAPWGLGHDAVAELKVALLAAADASWHVGSPDGPAATLFALPYEIPPQD